jgi:hypothetical protein
MTIELIAGEGCISSGWQKFPENMTAKDILRLYVESLSDSAADSELFSLVTSGYDEISDGIYCEQCGDTYYEYTLTIEIDDD